MQNKGALEARVIRAAEAALAAQQYVSAIDVLIGMGLLAPSNVQAWRKGRIDFLEQFIQGSPEKISFSMAAFRRWAQAKDLKTSETAYLRSGPEGTRDLQFTSSGDPALEKFYRTHYVSPELSERKQQNLNQRLSRPEKPAVFEIVRESQCSDSPRTV